jgi:3-oxoadipate enol-lactonase
LLAGQWFGSNVPLAEAAPHSMTSIAPLEEMFASTPLEGYIACGAAVGDMDHRELLPKIKSVDARHCRQARSGNAARGEQYIKNHIPGARLVMLDAAHISNVEQAEAYTNAVLEFLLAETSNQ